MWKCSGIGVFDLLWRVRGMESHLEMGRGIQQWIKYILLKTDFKRFEAIWSA